MAASFTPNQGLQITSRLDPDGTLTIALADVPVRPPGPDEVVVRLEAAPINPADLLTLLATADPAEARYGGPPERPTVTARVAPAAVEGRAARFGLPVPIGLEGAGVVVAAGEAARPLVGRTVGVLAFAGGTFAQYATVPAAACAPLPDGVSAREGAAVFVNPMTALAMVETVRLDGHAGLVHTAAASNLGQMLVKICLEDGVPLVNVVRRPEQAELLRGLGAAHVCDSSAPGFDQDLVAALQATGATVAFDAIGGGTMTGRILAAMETAAAARMKGFSPYGSTTRKQVHVYGRLDRSPLLLSHERYGLLWAVDGWTMPPVLERVGPERAAALRERILAGIRTTFASRFSREVSLAEALRKEAMVAYSRQATGEKYLIDPTL